MVIADVGGGLDASHPNLAGQLWVNPGEIAGNGPDDIVGLNPGFEGRLGSGRINPTRAIIEAARPLLGYEGSVIDVEPGNTAGLGVMVCSD